VHLVVAAFSENVSFGSPTVTRMPRAELWLYCKGTRIHDPRCHRVGNYAGETYGYLSHIVQNYDRLAPITVFSLGSILKSEWDFFKCKLLNYLVANLQTIPDQETFPECVCPPAALRTASLLTRPCALWMAASQLFWADVLLSLPIALRLRIRPTHLARRPAPRHPAPLLPTRAGPARNGRALPGGLDGLIEESSSLGLLHTTLAVLATHGRVLSKKISAKQRRGPFSCTAHTPSVVSSAADVSGAGAAARRALGWLPTSPLIVATTYRYRSRYRWHLGGSSGGSTT